MKTALVLEGGAMRGLFSCGVTDVMNEAGMTFDAILGVSAGAVFSGCNYKSHQPGRVLRYNLRFCKDPRFCSLRSWAKTGDLYGADFCYRAIPDELDPFDHETFAADPTDFYVVCTDAVTGRPVYRLCPKGDAHDLIWMRASASMPLMSRPVRIGDLTLLDGGIVEAVPLSVMEKQGYDRCVAVLTQPRGYRKQPTKGMPLFRLGLRRWPEIVQGMAVRHERYNAQMDAIDALEAAGRLLVIRPAEGLGISRTESDPEQLERVYQLGRAEAMKRLGEVQQYLATK